MFIGPILALTTVLCWAISIQFFEAASKRVGSGPVNFIRIAVALLLFTALMLVRTGTLLPTGFPLHAWIYLGLSGVIGFFLGDLFLFKSLVMLGPRLAMLIQSLAAPCAAVIGWLLLEEHYRPTQWLGILITLFGVALVIMERTPATPQSGRHRPAVTVKGVAIGLIAMLGQAVGYLLSKVGMQTESGYLDAFSSTQIRAVAAFICFILFFTASRKWTNVAHALQNKKAVVYTSVGAAIGPFIGVSLSLLILHYLSAGVAATFLSLVPVVMIPFAIFVHKEHVSNRAIAGTCIAIFGIYLLMA